jgi:hypothetical protein
MESRRASTIEIAGEIREEPICGAVNSVCGVAGTRLLKTPASAVRAEIHG